MLPALRHLLGFVDQHCHSLRADWTTVSGQPAGPEEGRSAGGGFPRWRACFTEATSTRVRERDVGHLLGYRHFLGAFGRFLRSSADSAPPSGESVAAEGPLAAERDRVAGDAYLRRLLDDAGSAALLVDTGYGGADALSLTDLRRAYDRDVREVVRLESVAESVLTRGGNRSLPDFVDAVLSRLEESLDGGAVAIKSILAYRAGLALPESTALARRQAFTLMNRRRQARRFDEPVLAPFLVREAAELAARRRVPLQFHTGFGDVDIDLPTADPALLRPLFHAPSTEGCAVVLLHCYPFVRSASHLAGVYPQVWMDLSLALPLAEPIGATLVREALALCPATKLLAASDGHSYPEMHWWGAAVWDRALREVLDAEVAADLLDEPAALDIAGRILSGNARELYGLPPAGNDRLGRARRASGVQPPSTPETRR